MELTCSSWLHGKHSPEIEINTKLPYVSIYDYFAQGEDADNVIEEINLIWNKEDITILQAIEKWASYYL
jgi:hypothetical protein